MDHNYAIWSPESFVFSPWSNDQSQQPLPQHYNSLGFSASVPGSLADLGSTNSELFYTTYCTPKTKSRTCAPGNGDELSIVPNQTVQSRRDQPSKSPRLPLFFSQLSPAFSWKNTPRIPRTYGDLRGGLDRITTLKRWRTTFYGSQSFWLLLYFSFNLLLTLSNKSVMTSFPFPYTLTAIHAMCSSFGGYLLRRQGFYIPRRLSFSDEMVLAAFSILYSVNIAVSNVSLHLVTVPVSTRYIISHPLQSLTLYLPVSSSCPRNNPVLYHHSFKTSSRLTNKYLYNPLPYSCHYWSRSCVSRTYYCV